MVETTTDGAGQTNMNERTHLDLFSGVCGFSIAAAWNGVRTIGFCEIDEYAQEIIKARFGAVMADSVFSGRKRPSERGPVCEVEQRGPSTLHPDIRTIDGRSYRGVWLISGGFPCTPFSLAGKRRGKEDDRYLWPQMFRVVSEARPTFVLGENVPGIINMELDRVLSDLESIGYACWPLVIPACAVDARHRRDRVWVVAHASSVDAGPRRSRGPEARAKVADGSQDASNAGRRDGEGTRCPIECGPEQTCGLALSAFCGVFDGLRKELDSPARWPDEDPETPRTATGVKDRVNRLKCLGNSIVPQVAARLIRMMILAEETVLVQPI